VNEVWLSTILYQLAISGNRGTHTAEVNMGLDLNPADFHFYVGFAFFKLCLTGFGLDLDLITLF